MEAYSQKIRELVPGAYENGDETAEIAEEFKVSRSWSRRVKQRLRECGSREAIQQKHGFDPKLGEISRLRDINGDFLGERLAVMPFSDSGEGEDPPPVAELRRDEPIRTSK